MKPSKDIAAGLDPDAHRRPWTAPITRRLSTSDAESNPAGLIDASEQLS